MSKNVTFKELVLMCTIAPEQTKNASQSILENSGVTKTLIFYSLGLEWIF